MSEVGSPVAPDLGLAKLNLNSAIDPAYSFVLPTLDFSTSAALSPNNYPSGAADLPFSDIASNFSPSDADTFSDLGYMSDGGSSGGTDSPDSRGWIEPPDALYSPRTPSWAGRSFSSAFSQRLEGPWEEVFKTFLPKHGSFSLVFRQLDRHWVTLNYAHNLFAFCLFSVL